MVRVRNTGKTTTLRRVGREPAAVTDRVVPLRRYELAVGAIAVVLRLLDDMERAGALRLPFNGHPETVRLLREIAGAS